MQLCREVPHPRGVVAAALSVQAAFLWCYYHPGPRQLMGDELRYHAEALAIARGQVLEPNFVWPPLQSQLLGATFHLFGDSLVPIQLLQILSLWGGGLLLFAIARRIGLSPAASALCLLAFVCHPELVAFSHYLWPEVSHLALLLLATYAIADGRRRFLFAAGVALGVALLLKSLLLPFTALFVLAAAWPRASTAWRPAAALVLVGMAVPVAPVVASNGLQHGYWAIASSAAFNTWVGLNERSPRNLVDAIVAEEMDAYLSSSPDAGERDRRTWLRVRKKLAEEGPLRVAGSQLPRQLQRLFDKDSFFTDQLPGGISARYAGPGETATRLLRAFAYGMHWLLLCAAVMGMWAPTGTHLRQRIRPFFAFLIGNLLLFAVLHVKTRYRLQFLPVLLIYAALFWDHVAKNLEAPRWGGLRVLGAASTLVLVLWLGFAPK